MTSLIIQFIKFGFVGIINNLVFFFVYYLVVVFNSDLYLLGNILGYFVSILTAYFINGKFVFYHKEEEKRTGLKLLKTYVVYLISLIISTVLLFWGVHIMKFSEKLVPLASLIITVPLSFLLNKYWIYKNKE